MLVIHIDIRVRAADLPEFLAATERNATSSLTEPGILRFDVVQDNADPNHIVLVEVYRDAVGACCPPGDRALRDLAGHRRRHDGRTEIVGAVQPGVRCGRRPVAEPGVTQPTTGGGVASFDFGTAGRVLFGAGRAAELPARTTDWGTVGAGAHRGQTGPAPTTHRPTLDALADFMRSPGNPPSRQPRTRSLSPGRPVPTWSSRSAAAACSISARPLRCCWATAATRWTISR